MSDELRMAERKLEREEFLSIIRNNIEQYCCYCVGFERNVIKFQCYCEDKKALYYCFKCCEQCLARDLNMHVECKRCHEEYGFEFVDVEIYFKEKIVGKKNHLFLFL